MLLRIPVERLDIVDLPLVVHHVPVGVHTAVGQDRRDKVRAGLHQPRKRSFQSGALRHRLLPDLPPDIPVRPGPKDVAVFSFNRNQRPILGSGSILMTPFKIRFIS